MNSTIDDMFINTTSSLDDLNDTLLENVLEESQEFDKERQRSVIDTSKQVLTSIIIIFSTKEPIVHTTNEFVQLLFNYIIVVLVTHHVKTMIIRHANKFYDITGHYVHEFIVEMLDFVFRFAICIVISLIKDFMRYTIDDAPFVIIGVAFYIMCSKIWIRHTQHRKMVYKTSPKSTRKIFKK